MECLLDIATQWATIFSAVGTVAVAILAIWGNAIRALIAGPKLRLQLRSAEGNLTHRADGKRTLYYHLLVKNDRKWSPAHGVRVMLVGISKKLPDESFASEPLAIPVQLTWAFPQMHEMMPTILDEDTCDLGFVDEGAGVFAISLYSVPNNFRGLCKPGERMRVQVKLTAHNFSQQKPTTLEVSWDGVWSDSAHDMAKHLVVKEIDA